MPHSDPNMHPTRETGHGNQISPRSEPAQSTSLHSRLINRVHTETFTLFTPVLQVLSR